MPDQLLAVPLTHALPLLDSPSNIHRLAMQPLPDLAGTSTSIRADLGVQFRLNLPTEPDGRSGHVVLRYRCEIPLPGAEPMPDVPDHLEAGVHVRARIVATMRIQDAHQKHHERAVFDEAAGDWVDALLKRHGLAPADLTVSPRWTVGRKPRSSDRSGKQVGPTFVVRDIVFRLDSTPTDQHAFHHGLGRGRAYGFGMLIPT